jgi:hypothetical protein
MNLAITTPPAFHVQRANGRRPVLGWGISLVVHALALAWIWQATSSRPAHIDARPARAIAVRLLPIAAMPAPVVVPRLAPATATKSTRPPSTSRQAPASAAPTPAIIAMPPAPASPIDAPAGATADAPAFDLAAARATARLITREEKKGLVALPGRQPADELRADTRTSERLERARRGDCLKGQEGTNLLANVAFLARDIVKSAVDDSGCKW